MLSHVKCSIFAHSLTNPPSLNNSCDVDLTLTNSKGRINLVKQEIGIQTKYLLSIPYSSSLGLVTCEQNVVDRFVRNLVLAMNLNLQRTALSILKGEIAQPDVQFRRSESQARVEETPEGKHIIIAETVTVREFVHVTMKFDEEIDEDKVVSTLGLINKLNSKKFTDNLKINNLRKSLTEYENGMKVFDRLMIFKHLFNSLELATNWDGSDRKSLPFDTEVATITGLPTLEVNKWRDFYNRTKHIDREPKEIAEFVHGMQNLPCVLKPLRSASNTVIIDRLKRMKNPIKA
jgi:hypothetical protein